MKQQVVLRLEGRQEYEGQEPEIIELVTEGTMEYRHGGWDICYEESELTGLAGVTTTFQVQPDKVVLNRTGALKSEMVFEKGVRHDSLYQMEFGTLMISVCANQIFFDIVPDGGVIDISYSIEIEGSVAGQVYYHLDIRAK